MAKYVPSPRDWVREQVELYESSGGTKGTTLRDTGLPVIIVTHTGNKTGAIRKTPLMRVKDGARLRARRLAGRRADGPGLGAQSARRAADRAARRDRRAADARTRGQGRAERARLWALAVAAYPPYADYQARTERQIPVFVAEP